MKVRYNYDKELIRSIFNDCEICHLSMVDDENGPYVVPMNYGFDDDYIYLHSGAEGQKMKFLKKKPKVCLNFSTGHVLRWQHEKVACSYGMKYKSIQVFGAVQFVEDKEDKIAVLDYIMKKYSEREFKYSDPAVREVICMKVKIDKLICRTYE